MGPPNPGATNGANGVNGNYDTLESRSNSKPTNKFEAPSGPPAPLATAEHHKPLGADRDGVTAALKRYAQSIHSSRTPLPTQLGDGTGNTRRKQTGFKVDLKHLGKKGTQISQPIAHATMS